MEQHSIRAQIEKRTRDTFGRHVWPHLFRDIAAIGFVEEAVDDIRLLLGHADTHLAGVKAIAVHLTSAAILAVVIASASALSTTS